MTAICPTTSPSRRLHRRPATAAPAASPRRSERRFCRETRSAGARPATTPATRATSPVKARTRASTRTSKCSGTGSGRSRVVSRRVRAKARRRSRRSAQETQDHALGEKLADHVPPSGADGHADADLAPPRRRAGEEHAGHVGASDEQDEADEEHQPRGQGHEDLVGGGMDAHALRREKGHPAILVGLRMGLDEPGHDAVEVGPGLLDGDSRLEPALHEHPALATPVEPARPAGRRHRVLEAGGLHVFHVRGGQPDLGREHGKQAAVALLDHAHDGVGLSAQAERLPTAVGSAPISRRQ